MTERNLQEGPRGHHRRMYHFKIVLRTRSYCPLPSFWTAVVQCAEWTPSFVYASYACTRSYTSI